MLDFNTNIALDAPDSPTLLGIKEGSASVLAGTILKCKCVCYSGNPRATLVWLNHQNHEVRPKSQPSLSQLSGSLSLL